MITKENEIKELEKRILLIEELSSLQKDIIKQRKIDVYDAEHSISKWSSKLNDLKSITEFQDDSHLERINSKIERVRELIDIENELLKMYEEQITTHKEKIVVFKNRLKELNKQYYELI